MRIAVLMTCYNRRETTLRCLKRLLGEVEGEHWKVDVFFVDDGSTDGTYDEVKKLGEGEQWKIHLIMGTGELFWCKGMNLAWKTAGEGYDGYLWLNDDVELGEGAIAGILKDAAEVGGESAIVGAFLDGRGKMTYGVMENWRWIDPTGKPRETTGDISGNLVYVPRKVMEKVGIIADCYSHAYGDYDYSLRMRKAGVKYYLASRICGRCDNNKPDYALEAKSLAERVKCLFKPNGHNWRDAIVYRYRANGFWRALRTAIYVPYLVIKGK